MKSSFSTCLKKPTSPLNNLSENSTVSLVLDGMDSKGGSLPLMPAPLNPVSMKQPGEPLAGRRARGDLGGDPTLLMDKAAAQLAATLQDSVLQKMATHSHGHERLKDLTSRVLNGDQEKLPKLCPPDPPILKGADTPPLHGSPPRKGASPELKLKITQMVAKGKAARFEPCCAEGPNLAPEGLLGVADESKAGRKRRTVKAKLQTKPRLCLVPAVVSPRPHSGEAAAAKVAPEQKAEVQAGFSVGDVVWTKVSGSPWWPCMVTIDPELNKHFKHKVNCRTGLLYHVQYFGDNPERGYMLERSMVSFRGEDQYQQLCRSNKLPTAAAFPKQPLVPRKLRAQWSLAVGQAQRAAGLPPKERLALFSFIYEANGPRLNPCVLEDLPPSPAGPDVAPPAPPGPAAPTAHPKHSTSVGKRTPRPKNTEATTRRGRRKLTASPLAKKAKALNSSKEEQPTQSLSQDPPITTDAQLLESQKKTKKSRPESQPPVRRGKKRSQPTPCAASIPEANTSPKKKPQPAPGDQEAEPRGKPGRKPSKRALEASADEPPRKRHRGVKVAEKLKVPDSSSTAKQKNTKKVKKETRKKGTNKSSLSEDILSDKPKRVRKKRQDTGLQPAPTQPKRRTVPDPEGSGSEERPDSPSDSIDGTKKHTGPKKESTCQVCELSGEDVFPCEGLCCGSFHLHCLGLALHTTSPALHTASTALQTSSTALQTTSPAPMAPGKLLCSQCSSGVHVCFSCKQWEGEVRRCTVLHCGKFYHEACVRPDALTVFDNKGFRCPLHTCRSCHYACRAKPRASKGRMTRCLRCPVAYHTGDLCVAAGSQVLSPNAIVCTNHFSAKKGYSHHSHVNVSWCFVCSKGGRLLCCESCPAAFHPDCLNIAMPDGSWFCNDCRAGKKPKYRDIIWVKLGNYRWWPAEIRHPRSIPTNIQHLRHQIGEFPVFFFGSRDYFWTHQGRVFPYMEGDRSNKHQKTGIGKVFKNALLEAETRFKEMKVEREAKEAQENNRKPPPYKYIKVNKPFGKVQVYTADVSEIPKCNCKPSDDKPCGFESECLNRMLMYECHPQVCPSAERCCNQDFTKRLYPETKIIKTAGKGWGLVSLRDIRKGEFVNEYVGELIDEEECRARIRNAQENDITHFYMLTIYKDRIIDAGPKGNYSRFMNHSCQPNCETQKWTVNGDTRVGLFAVCHIPAGTELTFNYNLDCLGNEKTVCRCGAPNCSGFLGDRPKSGQAESKGGKRGKKKVKRRRTKNEGKKPSEDECFRCGDGGQLVLCDKKSCTKAYHLSCLDRTKRPFGRWDCPWHHCDVCGKNSEVFCQLCPNSFCRAHQEGALRSWAPTGQLCCLEHEDSAPPRDQQA
ncbi:histone-lysine N-methyltransferase NSD2 [Osmerus mordax]|uniref:histone-lysine N-methyltransferase NSD2 n=1 Tax=Osmerus mordax TaxID=8014 RepID=UPI0035100480